MSAENEKGYVIRCHDLFNGSTHFRGYKGILVKRKEELCLRDTYTLSGAKRALSNVCRLCFNPDRYQYSLERLEECYFRLYDEQENSSLLLRRQIAHAMKRLDELWDGNDFDNGDKMRINEVRNVLRSIKGRIRKYEIVKDRTTNKRGNAD